MRVIRAALHEQAAIRLRTLIIHGELAPEAPINESDLSEALGISRTPLREALKLLASEGLIELRPNRSARVSPMRPQEIEELFEAAGGIERIAAELAASRATPRDLQRLRNLQERMERFYETGKLAEYFELNQQIHRFIVACARNSALKATHDWLLARVERARFFALSSQYRWNESVIEHRAILKALETRDSEKAGQLLDTHIRRTGGVVRNVLHQRMQPEAAAISPAA